MILLYGQRVDGGSAKAGDIVLARLADSPVGKREFYHYIVVKSDDPVVEAQLQARRDAGEAHPSIVYPYRTEKTDKAGNVVIDEPSTKAMVMVAYPEKDDPTVAYPVEENPVKAPVADKPKAVEAKLPK